MKISNILKDKSDVLIVFVCNNPVPLFHESEFELFYGVARWENGKIISEDGDSYDDYCDLALFKTDQKLYAFTYSAFIHGDEDIEVSKKRYDDYKDHWFELMENKYGDKLIKHE